MTILTIFMFSWPHLFSRVTTEDTHLFGIIFFVFITNHLLLSHIPFLELVCLIGSNDDDSFVINAELSSSSVAVVVEGIAVKKGTRLFSQVRTILTKQAINTTTYRRE